MMRTLVVAVTAFLIGQGNAFGLPGKPNFPSTGSTHRQAGASSASEHKEALLSNMADDRQQLGHRVEENALDARLYAFNKAMINVVKGAIDVVYEGNDYARFFVLETVARVPYFAYLSVMHLQETFGARMQRFR